MNIEKVRLALARGIAGGSEKLTTHIRAMQAKGRTGGIERAFSETFEAQLPVVPEREVPLDAIGAQQYYEGRGSGRVDCVIRERLATTAFEYKAVRMPRQQPHPRFDIGQLVADYLRLQTASKIDRGYMVVFLYGSILFGTSAGRLYQTFHNQMFIDNTLVAGVDPFGENATQSLSGLGWDKPWGSARVASRAVAVAMGDVGAVAIDCRL